MPHPVGLPDLFLDRSLGRIAVPNALREYGLQLVTLSERYGIPADESIADEDWLSAAGERGEVVLMKDERIRYNRAEKEALIRFKVRAFCLTRQDLSGAQMAQRILDNLNSIVNTCRKPGPFIYAIHGRGIRELTL